MSWIDLNDRTPTESDWDADGQIYVVDATAVEQRKELFTFNQPVPSLSEYTHWMPTNCETETKFHPQKKLILYARSMVRLDEMQPGLFAFQDCIGMKTEYRDDSGGVLAYIVDSGERFWAGADDVVALNRTIVQPVRLK